MIKVQNLSDEQLKEIGNKIGRSFWEEGSGLATCFEEEECINFFRIMTEVVYRAGFLYTTSENMEAFISYFKKKEKPGFIAQCKMLRSLWREISLKTLWKFVKTNKGWKDYEKQFSKEKDYVSIFMVVVLREYQGQGYLRKLLNAPFTLAKKENIVAILETDTDLKSAKYQRCGMEVVSRMEISDDIAMQALAYNLKKDSN